MKPIARSILLLLVVSISALIPAYDLTAEEIRKMTVQELRDRLSEPGLIILDVRLEPQWLKAETKIPGARHENPAELKSWAEGYPKDAHIVIYCA